MGVWWKVFLCLVIFFLSPPLVALEGNHEAQQLKEQDTLLELEDTNNNIHENIAEEKDSEKLQKVSYEDVSEEEADMGGYLDPTELPELEEIAKLSTDDGSEILDELHTVPPSEELNANILEEVSIGEDGEENDSILPDYNITEAVSKPLKENETAIGNLFQTISMFVFRDVGVVGWC